MNLTVLGPRIFVRPDDLPDTGESGLVLVHGRRKSTVRGTVVAVGDGPGIVNRAVLATLDAVRARLDAQDFIGTEELLESVDVEPREHLVQPGDRVLFAPGAGEELYFERDLLIAMTEDDVMAVIDGE